jgi:arylsulfatase A
VRCYNADSKVPTPNIDKLASEGMRFTDAHSPATVCTPSRYSLMTGQMAFRVPNGGTVFQGTGGPSLIAPGKLTLPGMLKKQGYATAAVGKWHIGLTFRDQAGEAIHSGERAAVQRIDYSRRIEGGPLDHGFDQFFGTACCPTTEWLYAFIDGDRIPVPPTGPIDKSKLPKHPYANDCRAGFIAPDFPMEEVDLVFLKKSREFIAQHARTSPKQPFFLYHATQAVHLPSFAAPEFQGKSKAGPHGDFIAEFDHIVGELMRELDQHGLADNTLVILSSDNGPEVASVVHMRADHAHDGAKPWRGIKRDAWEGGHRVPFIVRWPGKVKAGTTSDQTLCLTDILATVAAITGTELPHDAAEDSFNLLPALEGTATAPIRPYLLTQAFAGQRTLSIRRGQWKYIAHRGSGGNNYDKGELKPFALPDTDPEAPAQLYDLADRSRRDDESLLEEARDREGAPSLARTIENHRSRAGPTCSSSRWMISMTGSAVSAGIRRRGRRIWIVSRRAGCCFGMPTRRRLRAIRRARRSSAGCRRIGRGFIITCKRCVR